MIYASGRFIVVKNYNNPSECFVYRGHALQATVAKFSPNGYWVASADVSGKVRVWSWDNPEHLLKVEVPVFAGPVADLDWDNESKKIVAVGDGATSVAKVFQWDTGNSVGEIVGHRGRVLSVAYKPSRPFRIMTGGEDFMCCFYSGPPFKLDQSSNMHTNFVNCVRYAPNGSKIVSVGTDKKVQVYDGTSGAPVHDIVNAHDGGIYGIAFHPSSTHFATSSADKTIKIWNAETYVCEQTIAVSADPQIRDAQLAVVWTRDGLFSVALNGDIVKFSTTGVERVIQSHQLGLTALHVDRASQTVYSGSADGVVCVRGLESGPTYLDAAKLIGQDKKHLPAGGHGGKIVGVVVDGDNVVSAGWDDKLRIASATTKQYHSEAALNGQPSWLAKSATSDLVVVVTTAEVALFRGTTKTATLVVSTFPWTPTCAALLGEEEVAIGGTDNKTRIYSIAGSTFVERHIVETRSAVSVVSYSPGGTLLAIGDAGRQVEVYERGSWVAKVKGLWVFHTSKITALAWSPSGNLLASGSLDENIFIWNINNTSVKTQIAFSHTGGVSGLDWTADNKLISVGNDGVLASWNVPATA
ncbi:WD40 repeat domain-containing protein [archaeon]|nr:MAG: WD40 repeat domain-containing protein [archaeon]